MDDFKPKARTERLLRQELSHEVLIYDIDRNHAHCLNPSAERIWMLCDGERTVSEIGALVAPELQADDAELLVWEALDQFAEKDLLEGPVRVHETPALSRRATLVRLGLVATLVPLVDSIVAPPAAWAQSGSTGATGVTG